MPRPTARGLALLGLAVGTYLAGRVVGTWELYLFAFAFVAAVVISWLLVIVTGRRVKVARALWPERPVAGDEPELRMVVRNESWLPGPELTLRSPLAGLGTDDLEIEVESLAPRGHRLTKSPLGKVNRGVHHLPAARVIAEDPLGLATATHRASEPMRVTVHPRIALLDSCAVYPQMGLRHDWSGQQALPTPGAFEFRGIRPHQPGEPLSHIDWKSTAKTGVLMLRETEEPAGAEVGVLVDGTAAYVVGEPPHSNYELAVRAAGSIADYALRAGQAVSLLSHERELRRVRLSPDAGGRTDLLEALAEARPDAAAPVTHALRRLRSESARLLRTQSLTVVSLSLDHQLVRTLISLREEGVRLALVYVAGSDFAEAAAGGAPLLPFLPPRHPSDDRPPTGDPAGETAGGTTHSHRGSSFLPLEARGSLLNLAAAGVICLTLARGDDLNRALSLARTGRRREARRG